MQKPPAKTILKIAFTDLDMQHIDELVERGFAESREDLVLHATLKFIEDQAVQDVLDAEKEPTLSGDLEDLVQMFRQAPGRGVPAADRKG